MNYLQEINAFEKWLENNYLPASSQLLWYKLIMLCNRSGWAEWVTVDTIKLQGLIQCESKNSAYHARDKLAENGFIEYISGKKGKPTKYKLNSLCVNNEQETDSNRNRKRTENATENVPHKDKHRYKQKRSKDLKDIYGEFANVLLTAEELDKLKNRFPLDYLERIERVSEYVEQTGRKYDSHYATILSWSRKDKEQPQTARGKPNKPTFFEMLDNIVGDESEAIDI